MPRLGLWVESLHLTSSVPVLLTSGGVPGAFLFVRTILQLLCCRLRWVLIEFARVKEAVHRGHPVLAPTCTVNTVPSLSCGALVVLFALMRLLLPDLVSVVVPFAGEVPGLTPGPAALSRR